MCIRDSDELKERYADKRPYGEWLDSNIVMLKDLKIQNERVPEYTQEERQRMQRAFGYTYESLKDSSCRWQRTALRVPLRWVRTVSYTHLDVYKRQPLSYYLAKVGI